jgi:arsenate reductase
LPDFQQGAGGFCASAAASVAGCDFGDNACFILMNRQAAPMATPHVTIFHNTACGTSRKTLELIRAAGIEPEIVDYVKTPPSRAQLQDMIAKAGLSVRAAMRDKGDLYEELGLADAALSDDQLLDAMMAHPILINRPLVVTDKGVRLCRPSDLVLELL